MTAFFNFIKKYYLPFVLCIFFGIYLFLGISTLGNFQTADEDLWFADPVKGRIHTYWEAMRTKDWERTRINDKPGVSSAIFSGIFGLRNDREPEKKIIKDGNMIDQFDPQYSANAVFYYRLGILLTNGILVFFVAWFLWASTASTLVALFSSIFLFLSPILLGISQIVNPDAMLWSFGIATATGYFAFLVRGKWYYLLLAGIFFGFVLLSKYTGSFLFFILYGMTFASFYYIGSYLEEEKTYRNFVLWRLIGFILFCTVSVGIFILFMPAAKIEPRYLYEGTFNFKGASNMQSILTLMAWIYGIFLLEAIVIRSKITFFLFKKIQYIKGLPSFLIGIILLLGVAFSIFNWNFNNYFQLQTAPFDAGKEAVYTSITDTGNRLALQIKPLIFTLPPIIIFLFFFSFFIPLSFCKNLLKTQKQENAIRLGISLFGMLIIFFFYAALQQTVLVHVRYSILLYPIISVIAGISLALLISIISQKSNVLAMALVVLALGTSFYSLISIRPFYFNYTSDLLPKDQDVVGAWGYGGYQAAMYINDLHLFPEYVLAWSDYDGFCPFFKGECIEGSQVKWHKKGTYAGIDYFVVTRRGLLKNESTWNKIQEQNIVESTPIWSLYIGDRPGNFIEIYKAKNFTPNE
ncbi:MAG: phospholipid carrier-dependent glycosyltransferase [Candidatus Moraniibacteriota bacterium]|nr:MAG: phospholipid carrier-dependent glycosyltransferase [Candidatus Moranbacteria bacterium]